MNKKGLSPIIAVVLLIAFTIAVGGIMAVWLTGFSLETPEEPIPNVTTKRRVLKEYFVNNNYTVWKTCSIIDSFGESHVLETTNSSDCDIFFSKYPKYRSKDISFENIYHCPEGYETMCIDEIHFLNCLDRGNQQCTFWGCYTKGYCAMVVEE